MLYGTSVPLAELRVNNVKKHIMNRRVWVTPWSWVDQFPIATPLSGPCIYVSRKMLREKGGEFVQHDVEEGVLYLPKDCPLEERLAVPF
jgi:hypothetical protein